MEHDGTNVVRVTLQGVDNGFGLRVQNSQKRIHQKQVREAQNV